VQIDGSWQVAVSTPVGKQEVVFQIKTVNGKIEGTATQGEEVAPFENVVREGNRLRWTLRVTKPFKMHIKYDVTIEGNKMAGTARAGIFPTSKLSGERKTAG
jgi:hypothetical protein